MLCLDFLVFIPQTCPETLIHAKRCGAQIRSVGAPVLPTWKTEEQKLDSNQNPKRCTLRAEFQIRPVGRLWRELSRQLEHGLPGDSKRNVVNLCSFRGPTRKKLNLHGGWSCKKVLSLNNIIGVVSLRSGGEGSQSWLLWFGSLVLVAVACPQHFCALPFFPFLSSLDKGRWSGDRRPEEPGWDGGVLRIV